MKIRSDQEEKPSYLIGSIGVFNKTIDAVFAVILVFLMLGVLIGTLKLFLHLGGLVSVSYITGSYKSIISDVLSLFILIELSRSLVDYFNHKRIRITFIIEAAMVFVVREIMIKLYEHKISIEEIYALSVLLVVLGIVWAMAMFSYKNTKELPETD